MTITFPRTLPAAPVARSIAISPQNIVAVTESPYTLEAQKQRQPGQRWRMKVTLPPMPRDVAPAWEAFFASLEGPLGTFLLGDYEHRAPRGAGTGTPLVAGAAQTGRTLATDGWTALALVLRAGDHVQLGSGSTARLYMVLEDATADAGGLATLSLWPRVRAAPADDAAVTVLNPQSVFRLTGDPSWDSDKAGMYGFAFDAVEDL